jgi:asparagine synthase (glutamine-hydrolysing)
MCGIAGILWRVPRESGNPAPRVPDAWTHAMHRAVSHRGPDASGVHHLRFEREEGTVHVALLHSRLAIIDVATGAQPMTSACGSRTIVFNGCIDNHRALRATLLARGHRFVTHHSDTEALLLAHAEWGEGMPQHLQGSWACAIASERDVLLSQDFGLEKPLWWGRLRTRDASDGQPRTHTGTHDVLAFASVPAALAALQRVVEGRVRAASPEHLLAWLRHGAADAPVLQCAQPLRARGCVVSALALLEHGQRAVHASPLPARSEQDIACSDVEHALREGVALRLEADVPVGCFLSGGVDSSLLAAFAKRHVPGLHTFTVRMPDARYDESREARAIADFLGTQHHELPCDANPAADVQSLISLLGAPLADSSLLPTHWVARAARNTCSVCLTGDGGDELFAGYERHIAAMHMPRIGPLLHALAALRGEARRANSRTHAAKSLAAKLARLLHAASGSYRDLFAIFSLPELCTLFPQHADQLTGQLAGQLAMPSTSDARAFLDPLHDDFAWALPSDMLLKADHASMAVALETRAPFLSRGVQQLALRAPLSSLTSPDGHTSALRSLLPRRKALLRTLASRHLPAWVSARPKFGFALPLGTMLRTDAGLLALQHQLHAQGEEDFARVGLQLHAPAMRQLLHEHASGAAHHEQRIWALLVMQIWSRAILA